MSHYIHNYCHLKHPFTLFWALSGIIWLSTIPPPFPSSTNPFNERFLPVIFLCRNYLGNQITRFTGRTMDQFKKENMKTLTLCISCVFPPDSLSFCEWHEMYEPPIRFVSVLNFRLVYFSIYNWKINLGCNFSCCDIALQKNSKMLCWWMPTHQNYANPPGKKN